MILNWNDQTPLVLQTLAKGKRLQADDPFYQRPITVLADKAKAEMDIALKGLDIEVQFPRRSCQDMPRLRPIAYFASQAVGLITISVISVVSVVM